MLWRQVDVNSKTPRHNGEYDEQEHRERSQGDRSPTGTEVAATDLPAYMEAVDAVIAAAQQLEAPHKKWLTAEASRKSRARKANELAAMKARLAELEGSVEA